MHVNIFFNLQNVSVLCNCGCLAIIVTKNSIDATIWSEILQYGLTYTMQTWSHIYDAIRCEPSDVSGYLIRTSGCLIWHDLTTLRNSLDLQYSHTFIHSIRFLLLLTFRSLAAGVSEKSTVFTLSYRKAKVIKFDHAIK